MSGAARALQWMNQRVILARKGWGTAEPHPWLGLGFVIIPHERGIPSKRES